jgi:hypothetical protein
MNVFPPSVDFHVTTLAVKTVSGSLGWTFTSAKSDARSVTRGSALAGVVGAVEPAVALRLDGGVEPARIARRHRDADPAQAVVGEGR